MRKFLSLIILLVLAVSLYAVPANRKPIIVKQSDGSALSIILQGDEALHFYTTLDGKYLVKGAEGDYFYATFSQVDGFVSTGTLAHNAADRNETENALLSTIDYDAIDAAVSATHKARLAEYRTPATRGASTSSVITKGEVTIPVLLVEFSDKKFSFKKEDINKLLNEEDYKYNFSINQVTSFGSARDYFIAQSGGLFRPNFVVTDIITLQNPMAYYGGNATASQGSDKNPQAMIRDAITIADATVDFSKFDNDGDGNVEFIYCIYAGYAESNGANTNTIWPHQHTLSAKGGKKKVDNVYCDTYACSSELYMNEQYEDKLDKWLAGIGTICHEFSHCLGLHDVYDVKGGSGNWGMDEWDLMANGNYAGDGYIPVGYNSYQKDVCGWKKLEVLKEKGTYSMKPQTQGGVGYKIVNDANPNEYFILENRKREGWDQTLKADGMMIMHVDYDATAWSKNEINVTPGHPRFQIVPADNELLPYGNNATKFYESMAKDLWPGPTGNNKFTNTSIPAATVFKGGFLNKPVTDIKYEDYIASFDFMGGAVVIPEVQPATEVTTNSFVANWATVTDATEYVLELYKLTPATNGNGDVEKLLKEDFLLCNSSNTETSIHANIDDYMTVKGWSGENIFGENGVLRVGSYSQFGTISTPKLKATGSVVISFNVSKYRSTDNNLKLTAKIIGTSNNKEISISSIVVTKEGNAVLKANVDGEFFVRFSTDGEANIKRAKLDDVEVSVTLPYKRELINSITLVENSYRFEGLEIGKYAYRVKAIEGDEESAYSDYVDVRLGETTVIELQNSENGVVEVYTFAGVKIYIGRTDTMPALPRGKYIVKSAQGVKKIFVK